jgi:hypothetical protein
MVSLRLVPVSGNPIEVTKDPSLVGRDPGCEIVVTDGSVSRRHARLERRQGVWWVVDQGSANGTYVNSLKVAETALKNSQELRFGAMAFRVDLAEDPEATVAAPAISEDTVMATPRPEATPKPSPAAPPPAPPPAPPRAAGTPPPPPPPPAGAGTPRRGVTPPVPQMPAGGGGPAKKGRGPLFWSAVGCCGCILLAILLAGLISGGLFVMTKGAADAAQAHLQLIRQGDIEAAYADLSDELRAQVSLQDYERLIAQHEILRHSTDATFFSRSVDNDRAVLHGVVTTADGQSEQITMELVKRGGAWKITALRFDDED